MAVNETELADLRRQIDEIDDRIHSLLMQRAEITRSIGRVKGGDGLFIRPGREAEVLRRLVRNHQGPFPRAALAMIWREIFSGSTLVQGEFSVAVLAGEGTKVELRGLTRDHFGVETPVKAMTSQAQVLRAVSEGEATVAVLPLPDGEEASPWWVGLARQGADVPRIVARLPFVPLAADSGRYEEALVVACIPQEETGEDCSFLAVEMTGELSRSALRGRLEAVGVEVATLFDHHTSGGGEIMLLQCVGYIAEGDPRLARLVEESDGAIDRVWAIGGYAQPLTQEEIGGQHGRRR